MLAHFCFTDDLFVLTQPHSSYCDSQWVHACTHGKTKNDESQSYPIDTRHFFVVAMQSSSQCCCFYTCKHTSTRCNVHSCFLFVRLCKAGCLQARQFPYVSLVKECRTWSIENNVSPECVSSTNRSIVPKFVFCFFVFWDKKKKKIQPSPNVFSMPTSCRFHFVASEVKPPPWTDFRGNRTAKPRPQGFPRPRTRAGLWWSGRWTARSCWPSRGSDTFATARLCRWPSTHRRRLEGEFGFAA